MATTAAIQAQLGTKNIACITRTEVSGSTYDRHYTVGGIGYAGKSCWCRTTAANTAAQQATEITTALATPGPVDPNLA